jgi:hypothetical protein
MPAVQRALPLFIFIAIASCQQQACPSMAGGPCDPRNANCPTGYQCALAEICTRTCEQTSDCWVPVGEGCRYTYLPGQRLPDGGVFVESSEDGFCSETKLLECVSGYCQRQECLSTPCDYDLYGPSENKGNRSQGPMP